MKKLICFIAFVLCTTVFAGLDQVQEYGLSNAVAVTASDTTTYNPPLRVICFNATAAQTLKVDMAGTGTAITFTFGTAGTYERKIAVKKIYSTGTTVTQIVGLY
jgi:hypothetical protein